MSAKQSNCSLYLILRTPCGSSRDKESHFFCRRATRTFLRIFRVIIYRNVAMLLKPSLSWLARAGTRVMSVTQFTRITISPKHRPLLGRFYRAPKSSQVTSLVGKHVINFQIAVEICCLFGKTIILLLSDRLSIISFAGFGYFFLNRELFPIVRLHIYILLHFTFEFSGGAIPIPRLKFCSNAPS